MDAWTKTLVKVARLLDALTTDAERVTMLETMLSRYDTTAAVENAHHRGRHKRTAAVVNAAANGRAPTPSSFLSSSPVVQKPFPEELQEIPVFLRKISAPPEFDDAGYWISIHAWLGDSRVGYLDELAAYLAWWFVQSGERKHRDLKRGFRNWLSKSAYWSEQQAQRQAVRMGR